MNAPLVTAIIPAFNRASVIADAMRSVLGQTWRDLELIVVDDASSDETVEIARQIQDERVTVLAQPQNQGVSAARNAGAAAARGEFLAFLDSDDAWLPEKLERQIALIQSAPRPEATVCGHAFRMRVGGVAIAWPKRGPQPEEALSDYLFVNNGQIQTSTWLLPRALFQRFRFDETLRRHEDWDLLLRLAADGADFRFLAEPLAERDAGENGARLSNIRNAEWSDQFARERTALFTRRALPAFRARVVASQYALAGRRLRAFGCIWSALRAGVLAPVSAGKLCAQFFAPRLWQMLLRIRTQSPAP